MRSDFARNRSPAAHHSARARTSTQISRCLPSAPVRAVKPAALHGHHAYGCNGPRHQPIPPTTTPTAQKFPSILLKNCCRFGIEHMYDEEVGGAGSVKELADAIACLQVAPLAGEIEELLAQRDRLDAKISESLAAFEAEPAGPKTARCLLRLG